MAFSGAEINAERTSFLTNLTVKDGGLLRLLGAAPVDSRLHFVSPCVGSSGEREDEFDKVSLRLTSDS